MKALISPNEVFNYSWISSWVQDPQTQKWNPVYSEILSYQRVAQVEPDNKIFQVAEPLYWLDCPDDCKVDLWYFKDGQVFIKPQDEPAPELPQPVSQGTQTL
jgi:hypothetical protein